MPTSSGEFTLGGTGSYMGKRYFDLGEHNQEGSYTRVDLQASWTSPEGRYKVLGLMTNATDEEVYNTYGCNTNLDGVYGTDSFIPRRGGNPIDQRLWEVQFMMKIQIASIWVYSPTAWSSNGSGRVI